MTIKNVSKFILTFFICILLIKGGDALAQIDEVNHWETVVYSNDVWKYFVGTSEPDADWRNLTFDDSSWMDGKGGFGYGDGDDSTIVAPTISVYLRKAFTLTDTSQIKALILHIDYDDAFVAFLNNQEIARSNIGQVGDYPTYDQSALTYMEALMYQGGKPQEYLLDKNDFAGLLLEGENVLAIQGHNYGAGSSDLTSIPFLSVGIGDDSQTYGEPPDWFFVPKVFTSSNLPLVYIDTYGQEIPDEPRIVAHMGIINNPSGINKLSDPFNDYDGRINIEIRGSSSQMFPKKSYSIETQDEFGENLNMPLLGMPEENDWIFYAPYSDKSLMRNVLTYQWWNDLGHYGPRTKYCELFVNDEYKGIYVLTERIKRDKNRVNIAKLTEDDVSGDDVTGGYIVKVDKPDGDEGWTSVPYPRYPGSKLTFFQYNYPEFDDILPAQKSYIMNFMEDFESNLGSTDYNHPQNGYTNYIDVNSFIDFLIVNEIAKNIDGYRFSTFMHKAKDSDGGKLIMGPVWDFNLCYGNVDYGSDFAWLSSGWMYTYVYEGDDWNSKIFWWKRLMEDFEFKRNLQNRWLEVRQGILSNQSITNSISSIQTYLDESKERNFEKWNVLGNYVWPNYYVGQSYEQEVMWLNNWIINRLNWMDSQWNELVSVEDNSILAMQVYPNPFRDFVNFRFSISKPGDLKIEAHNLTGQTVWTDQYKSMAAGDHIISWDGADQAGQAVLPGVYVFTISLDGTTIKTGKLVKY